jgi:hypothetical protein
MKRRWVSAMVLGWALSGCATMFPPVPAGVSFQSTPSGAEVYVNGVPIGRTPVSAQISCDQPQEVVFTREGYHTYLQRIPTVSGWDGRYGVTWPADHCAPVVSVVLAPLQAKR